MTPSALYALIEATWPPAGQTRVGPYVIREGQGGGSRVSAATAAVIDGLAEGLPAAEAAMRALGQTPLFMIRHGDETLDALLDRAGYVIKDPVIGYSAPVSLLTQTLPPPVTTFEVWPPVAVQAEIWAEGGIGPDRLAVMDRAKGPKTTILGRLEDSPAGTVYLACGPDGAMLHALETRAQFRRKGLGTHMPRACARWAARQGAEELALVVTTANTAARGLYASLGMSAVGEYHYRIKTETGR